MVGLGAYPAFRTRLIRDMQEFFRSRPDISVEDVDHATPEITYDLDTARKDKPIHNRAGDRIFVLALTGVAHFRTRLGGPLYEFRVGPYSLPFQKILLTNTAQTGKNLTLIIGYEAFIEFAAAHTSVKSLNVANTEINPATKEGQDSIVSELQGELAGITHLVDIFDEVVAAGATFEFANVSKRGFISEFLILASDPSFSVIVNLDSVEVINRTYLDSVSVSCHIAALSAFEERDEDGILTGKYVFHYSDIAFKESITISVKNNSGSNLTFDNLFCKYKTV